MCGKWETQYALTMFIATCGLWVHRYLRFQYFSNNLRVSPRGRSWSVVRESCAGPSRVHRDRTRCRQTGNNCSVPGLTTSYKYWTLGSTTCRLYEAYTLHPELLQSQSSIPYQHLSSAIPFIAAQLASWFLIANPTGIANFRLVSLLFQSSCVSR